MKIAIGSGKGGVGKSFIAASLISILSKQYKLVCMDCDVDAPNLDLMLGIGKFDNSVEVKASSLAQIDYSECIGCMECYNNCTFDAISENDDGEPVINDYVCEGCGVCGLVCPQDAVSLHEVGTGVVSSASTKYGFFVTAQLYPGRAGSGKIVEEEKKLVENYSGSYDHIIADLPAGIGCPVISSLNDMDYFVGVVEPTQASFDNLKRMINVVNHFNIPYSVVLNKFDANPQFGRKIEREFAKDGVDILSRITYDSAVPKSAVNMVPLVEYAPNSQVAKELHVIAKKLEQLF